MRHLSAAVEGLDKSKREKKMTDTGKGGPKDGGLTTSDRVYGAVGAAALLLALYFLVAGGPKDTGAAAASAPPPPLRFVEMPAEGAGLAQPLTLTFDAGEPLDTLGSARGGALHVHVRVGGLELMTGPGSTVAPVRGTVYRWTLPPLPPGEQTFRLFWSDAAHRAIEAGASAPLTLRLLSADAADGAPGATIHGGGH
jgi:hypothetical protein